MLDLRFALVTVLALAVFATAPVCSATTSDFGEANAVREIRRDSALLLAHGLAYDKVSPVIESVVTDGATAVVQWRAGAHDRGVIVLQRSADKWKWRAAAATADYPDFYWSKMAAPGNTVDVCGETETHSPTVDDLQREGLIDAEFAKVLGDRLKVFSMPHHPTPAPIPACDDFGVHLNDTSKGFDATFSTGEQYLDQTLTLAYREGCEQSLYGFSLRNAGGSTFTMKTGGKLTIWFPYVLSPDQRYELRLAGGGPDRTIDGAMNDNSLAFSLPEYALPASAEIKGCVRVAARNG